MQTTQTSKPHYPILDGLRGVAALLVVIFHFMEAHFPVYAQLPVHHGYLAVDFFFLLSGFVVGYAYDDRWGKMSVWAFFRTRLIRLHPMVIFAILLGAVCFWFDPFLVKPAGFHLLKLIGFTLLALTLLPSPDVRGWGETHSLNGPCWSLLQEYIANIAYALFGRKLNRIALWILVVLSGAVLTAIAVKRGDVATGWGFSSFGIGVARMAFPFFAGLLLFRSGHRLKVPAPFVLCSLALVVLFILPTTRFNGLYESACIILAFPLIVAAGASADVKGSMAKVCQFFGDISYPLYITHYPLIYLYTGWIYRHHPKPHQIALVATILGIVMIALAYGAMKLYDAPVRAWLKRRLEPRSSGERVGSPTITTP
jgi:peptidoglycan/LPS O-acetylase OafA/YrhL